MDYPFERDGPKRVEISWHGFWKQVEVKLDGELLGVIENQRSLNDGRDFSLGDGTTLSVQLVTGLTTELQVRRDGAALPGSASDPTVRLKVAWVFVFVVAVLRLVVGIVASTADVESLQALRLSYSSLSLAALYAALGFAVMRYRSAVALVLAVASVTVDGVVSVVMEFGSGLSIALLAVVVPMLRGLAAIFALKNNARLSDLPS